jgi:hypothetical protein
MDDDAKVPFASIVEGLTTEPLVEGDETVSVFALIKTRDAEGDFVWAARSAGDLISSEELLGTLVGIATSIRNNISSDWDW